MQEAENREKGELLGCLQRVPGLLRCAVRAEANNSRDGVPQLERHYPGQLAESATYRSP